MLGRGSGYPCAQLRGAFEEAKPNRQFGGTGEAPFGLVSNPNLGTTIPTIQSYDHNWLGMMGS